MLELESADGGTDPKPARGAPCSEGLGYASMSSPPTTGPGTSSAVVRCFTQFVERRVPPAAAAWFATRGASARSRQEFGEFFTLTARALGKATLALAKEEVEQLAASGVTWPIGHWGLDELGRVTVLLEASALAPDELLALVTECYDAAENRERQAVLKALAFLPEPQRFVELAVDACRTSILPVFEAIACENPYPARHFPELNFNQMVLKAVFVGLPLERIAGLEPRLTAELSRMALDYASERRAAGRPVPGDLSRLIVAS